jgi:hypothetical protein
MAQPRDMQNKSLTGSDFEKKGGYASPKTPVASLPKVPAGAAPGATPKAATQRK